MTDEAHVQTKANQSLSESDAISVILIRNPESSPVSNYRTAIDPALVLSRPAPLDQKVIELDDSVSPAWFSKYGTGVSEAEIFHKRSILANGLQQIAVGDGPWISDVGPSVDLADSSDPTSLIDDWHKTIVTDLTDDDIEVISAAQTGAYHSSSSLIAQYMLYPISSRHIVKTGDGVLHAVVARLSSGVNRVFYLRSGNGGRTWTSTAVDLDDGRNYIYPSITCDSEGGIHITFTRHALYQFTTYWLYSGSDIPSGFELISNVGGIANQRLLGAADARYMADLSDAVHGHSYSASGGDVIGCSSRVYPEYSRAYCTWHHTATNHVLSDASSLPICKSLKMIQFYGIPNYIPAGVVLPFNTPSLPAGVTRYSAQDGYPIYLMDDVGVVYGAAQHRHVLSYNYTGSAYCQSVWNGSGTGSACDHSHTGSVNTAYADNSLPKYGVVLASVDSDLFTIPQNSIIFTSSGVVGTSFPANFVSLSLSGETLFKKYLVGAASYSDLGGSLQHDHADLTFDSVAASNSVSISSVTISGAMISMASYNHKHRVTVAFDPGYNVMPYFSPRAFSLSSDLPVGNYSGDLFYVYISPTGVVSSPVNISQMHQYFPSMEASVLVDAAEDVHVLYACQGLNTTPGRSRICYIKKSSGSWGSRVDITTDDYHMQYPSMDIDVVGDIHAAWFNATTCQSLQYRKCVSGAWDSIEDVDTSSYVGVPGNIITDKDCNVFLFYAYWTDAGTAIKEVLYRKRTSGGWGAAVNLTPGKAAAGYNQFPGQALLDNKGNVIITITGKGYGAHTSVYHPVYRYITPDGTVVPSTVNDAVDFFPDDDNEIIYPTVFWHSYPLTDDVYQNLVVSGFTFLYLYNPRNTSSKDTADLRFYSSPNALVGDVGAVGSGGSGEGDFVPSGVSAESIFQHETFTINNRGHLNFPHIRSIGIGKSVF